MSLLEGHYLTIYKFKFWLIVVSEHISDWFNSVIHTMFHPLKKIKNSMKIFQAVILNLCKFFLIEEDFFNGLP